METTSAGCAAIPEGMAGAPARLRNGLAGLARRAARGVFAAPGYRLTLLGRTPATLRMTPADLWPGDRDTGAALAEDRFRLAGREPRHGADIWSPPGAAAEWLEAMHGFTWLRDLRALGGDAARRKARGLATNWLDHNADWSLPAWRGDVVATRLVAWLSHYETFFASGGDDFRQRLVASMMAQQRHLARALRVESRGSRRITGIKGLIHGVLCLGGGGAALERWLSLLGDTLEAQVLADGGHIERRPDLQVSILRDLIDIRAALGAGQREIPESLQNAIDRMAPMLRYLRLGDGGLARFNGGGAGDPAMIDAVLAQAAPRGKAAARAPHSGFERLSSGKMLVLADAGGPPPPPFDARAHAGSLGLEISIGVERLIVSCGPAPGGNPDWSRAARATAAHSTLVVADRNSSEIVAGGGIGPRRATVTAARESDNGAALVVMSHDGYGTSHAVVHRRRLYLAQDEEDLRGEDSLTGPAGVAFAVRFHLHPDVRASLLRSGQSVLLRLAKGGGWRLRANQPMELADSIYFSAGPEPKRTSQIVIPGVTQEGTTTVKWALQRETRNA